MKIKSGTALRSPQQMRAQSFFKKAKKPQRMTDAEYDKYLDLWDDYVNNPDSPLYEVEGDISPELYNCDIEEGRRDE